MLKEIDFSTDFTAMEKLEIISATFNMPEKKLKQWCQIRGTDPETIKIWINQAVMGLENSDDCSELKKKIKEIEDSAYTPLYFF